MVKIGGKPALRRALQLWQGHERIPAGRKAELQPVGRPTLPLQLQNHGCQGQKAVVAIEMAGAHRELGGQHRVADFNWFEAGQL